MTSPATAHVAPTRAGARGLLPVLGWAGFCLLVVYAVLVGGGYGGIQSVAIRILSLVIVAVALGTWLLVAWRRPAWRPGTSIWPAVVIPPATLAVATALSEHPRLGVEYAAWATLLAALYLLLVRIVGREFVRVRIGGLAAMLGLAIGLLYIGVVVNEWLRWWEVLGRLEVPPLRPALAGLPLGGPNLVASASILLTIVAVAGIGIGTRARRIALTILVAITAAVVLLSGSRSAWLAIAVSVALVGGAWLIVNRRVIVSRLGGRLTGRRGMAIAAVGITALVVAALAVGPAMLDRFLNAGDGGRPSYWAAAIRMWQDAPLLGHGPGTWAAERVAWLAPTDLDYVVPHAHDVYLQTLAELGLVGLLLGAVALTSVLWLVVRSLRAPQAPRRAWAWATLLIGGYLAVVDVVDFYANLPGLLLVAVIPIALLDGWSDRGIGVPAALRPALVGRVATLALVVGCVVSLAVLGWAESTALAHARAVAAADAGDWPAAQARAQDAVAADPGQPSHQLTLALAAMHAGDWETAGRAYQLEVATDDLPQAWLGLALATLEAGGPSEEVVRRARGGHARRASAHPHQPRCGRGLRPPGHDSRCGPGVRRRPGQPAGPGRRPGLGIAASPRDTVRRRPRRRHRPSGTSGVADGPHGRGCRPGPSAGHGARRSRDGRGTGRRPHRRVGGRRGGPRSRVPARRGGPHQRRGPGHGCRPREQGRGYRLCRALPAARRDRHRGCAAPLRGAAHDARVRRAPSPRRRRPLRPARLPATDAPRPHAAGGVLPRDLMSAAVPIRLRTDAAWCIGTIASTHHFL